MCQIAEYEPQTTFWEDFAIAEQFGTAAVQNTYDRVMKEWSDNYIYLTELVMVLNWNIWYWHALQSDQAKEYEALYNELFEKTDAYCLDYLNGDELSYFLRTVD